MRLILALCLVLVALPTYAETREEAYVKLAQIESMRRVMADTSDDNRFYTYLELTSLVYSTGYLSIDKSLFLECLDREEARLLKETGCGL